MLQWFTVGIMRLGVHKKAQGPYTVSRGHTEIPKIVKERGVHMRPKAGEQDEGSMSDNLIFDMELSVTRGKSSPLSTIAVCEEDRRRSDLIAAIHEVKENTNLLTEFEKQVMQAYALTRGSCEVGGILDLHLLAQTLERLDFDVKLVDERKEMLQVSGCCRVRHRFLLIYGTEHSASEKLPYTSPAPLILDPQFKAQFDIPNPSPAYSTLLESVHEVYLGSYERLEQLVRLLCCEMNRSFEMTKGALPPWRSPKAMLSRWMHPLQYQHNDDIRTEMNIVGST